jgi:transcriptional regulator with XRE-family HTH domain
MNERIKSLRKELGLNQTDFGARIGVKQGTITGYETGIRVPSDAIILDICDKFSVNQYWLETGEGEMFVETTREEEISSFLADVQMDGGFKAKFIAGLSALDASDWENLRVIFEKMHKKMADEE